MCTYKWYVKYSVLFFQLLWLAHFYVYTVPICPDMLPICLILIQLRLSGAVRNNAAGGNLTH